MKKDVCINRYLMIFLFLVVFPVLCVKAAEIILPGAPPDLFEGTYIPFEVKGVESSRFRWDFGDGSVKIGGSKMNHVYRRRGTYRVSAADLEKKIKHPITRQIKILKDNREIVFIGQVFYPGVPVKMEARYFIDRTIRWDFGDGKNQKLDRSVTHVYQRSGTYKVKAVDFAGKGSKTISKKIKISEDNRSIVIPDEIIVGELAAMSLKNAASGDYTWEFSDGQRASGLLIKTGIFKRQGRVTVTVTDPSGTYPPLTQTFVVKPDNRRLKGSFTFALPEEAVRFQAEHFKGPTITWDFGDGTIKTNGSKTETHQYKTPGRYQITARDFNGTSQKTFSTNLKVDELSPDFQLTYLEITFTNGKYYQVAPLKNAPPSYYVRMKANGRGILRGKWILDQRPIGLFQVLLHQNKIVDLKGSEVMPLPMKDLGIHNLTIDFTNYNFQKQIPMIRYFVTEIDAIMIEYPQPGAKLAVSHQSSLLLKWKSVDPYANTKWAPTYQVLISKTPIQFLSDDQMTWKDVSKQTQYSLDLSPFRDKDELWLYWRVRALKSNGDPLTISETSSFKLAFRE